MDEGLEILLLIIGSIVITILLVILLSPFLVVIITWAVRFFSGFINWYSGVFNFIVNSLT